MATDLYPPIDMEAEIARIQAAQEDVRRYVDRQRAMSERLLTEAERPLWRSPDIWMPFVGGIVCFALGVVYARLFLAS